MNIKLGASDCGGEIRAQLMRNRDFPPRVI